MLSTLAPLPDIEPIDRLAVPRPEGDAAPWESIETALHEIDALAWAPRTS